MDKLVINTNKAPQAIGTYSQAIKAGKTLYLSGQIPLIPDTMKIINNDIKQQITQVFYNLLSVCKAAGGDLTNIVKLNIFLTDLSNFAVVNNIMAEFFVKPYPARAVVEVSKLPKDVLIEIDGVAVI